MSSCVEKLEVCEVCGKDKAKYTCPKCEVRTCSLTCSNIHKKELDCDGIRDKTKYLPIKSITDLDLASDYCLLQEVGRCVDKYDRDQLKRITLNNFLPPFLRKLKYAAFKRGVTLEFMPRSFSRNKQNTTRFIWNKNELLWRIDWIFPQAENIKWTTPKSSEKARLSVLIENVLEPDIKGNKDPEAFNLKYLLRNKLQFYRAAGLKGIKILMKAEKVQKSNSRFYELDMNLTLAENLEQKTIIEYPTFYVILSHNSDMYDIINSGDESEIGQHKNPQHRHKFKGNEKSLNAPSVKDLKQCYSINSHIEAKETKPINFLFHTEFTDSEDERGKLEKESVANVQVRKRKPRRNQKTQIQKRNVSTRDSVNKFTRVCKSDSEEEVQTIEKIQKVVVQSLQVKSLEFMSNEKSSEIQKPSVNCFINAHITDSEDDGPVETPIQRLLQDEKEIVCPDKNKMNCEKNENHASIKSIAMNYFSAYMSDSEDETASENAPNSSNSELQIPDYNILVKMNH